MVATTVAGRGVDPWRATLAGLGASFVGIGLARFAYTPLIPALIAAGWFSPSDAAYLGAANLAGYLAGALAARPLAARAPARPVLRAMMVLTTASLFACAAPLGFVWFFLWRFASGFGGGVLMVLAAPTILPHVPAARRGLAGGAVFTGVGLGIAASGTLVPLLARSGLVLTWCGLGALALALTLAAWGGWPAGGPVRATAAERRAPPHRGVVLKALYLEYALNALGLVPHMVFLVDFVARGLGRGLAGGAQYWVLFGVGALLGPMVLGAVADRIGFAWSVRLAYLVQAVSVASITLAHGPVALAVSSLVIGAFTPGVTTLVLGRLRELAGPELRDQQAAWSVATVAFSVGQAGGAYAFSFLFARTGDYVMLFALGAVALTVGLAVNLVAASRLLPANRRVAGAGTRADI